MFGSYLTVRMQPIILGHLYVLANNRLVAPTLMQPKFLNSASSSSSKIVRPLTRPAAPYPLLRLPTSLPAGFTNLPNRTTSSSLAILEAVDKLASLSLETPKDGPEGASPSLIRGFKATVPSSEIPKQRRRMLRGGIVDQGLGYEKIGLKKLGDRARGLLTEHEEDGNSKDSLGVGRKSRKKKRARISESRHLEGRLHLEDLLKQADEIAQDKENLHVRTVSIVPLPSLE